MSENPFELPSLITDPLQDRRLGQHALFVPTNEIGVVDEVYVFENGETHLHIAYNPKKSASGVFGSVEDFQFD